MKFSITAIFLVALINGALSRPGDVLLGYQDNLGQYSFGYSAPHQARSESRSIDGVTRGSYSYVDSAGLIQSTDYIADGQNGFRVAATNLPQAPVLQVQETPEVAAARAAHLLAVEEAARGVQPSEESDSVTILSKSAEPEAAEKEQDASRLAEPEEPAKESDGEPQDELPSEIQTPEALAAAALEADAAEKKDAELKEEATEEKKEKKERDEEGRALDESAAAVAPVIASPVASLPVPLIPINFDLPTIAAYSSRLAGTKADLTTLPQSTPAQGVITPASTMLKTLPGAPQLVALSPQIALTGEPAAPATVPASAIASGRDFVQYERARAVFTPVGPVNVLPLGYDPATTSFFRTAPFPYVTYNIL